MDTDQLDVLEAAEYLSSLPRGVARLVTDSAARWDELRARLAELEARLSAIESYLEPPHAG